jgi:hypothetical protein
MKRFYRRTGWLFAVAVLSGLVFPIHLTGQNRDITVTVHIRGVYESNISLLALNGSQTFKPILRVQGIKNGETSKFKVLKDKLPGEFVLRFDYKKNYETTSYPSERTILINDQDLEMWTNPEFCNNADSTWFQKDEKENAAWIKFIRENNRQKEKPGLLQDFLMNYDDSESKFYRLGIEEFEKRRQAYNHWLTNLIQKDKMLFASNLYCFQYIPKVIRQGNRSDRIKNLINNYFEGMDFMDPRLIKTTGMSRWMDGYVNLYGQLATDETNRDSLFSLAGKTAVEKAQKGHPLVYGWMVDYFFTGYEKNNIPAGMKILEPYLNDPNCLTTKRMEINRRLKGMESLTAGTRAPDIQLKDAEGIPFNLYGFNPSSQYILLLFWSADCNHCIETVDAMVPWQRQPGIMQKLSVVAISLDESETEIAAWNKKIKSLPDWKHLRPDEGIRSKVANDYFILSTPVMIMIDSGTKEILSLPSTLSQLKKELQ